MTERATTAELDQGAEAPSAPPLLVSACEAARLCGIGRTAWYALVSSGRAPAPIRLGGRVLWPVDLLREWVAAGCPTRDRWAAMNGAATGGRKS